MVGVGQIQLRLKGFMIEIFNDGNNINTSQIVSLHYT